MAFDNSRFTFDPRKNYSGVVMEQGRVQLDSDWNEGLAENARRIQAGALDILGHAVYPMTTPAAFQITVSTGPAAVLIGCGRLYIDGLMAENHGLSANAQWDPALAELSGAPQPPPVPALPPSPANTVDFTQQPYLPGAVLPDGAGPYLFYLDAWTRAVTYLEDPGLIDQAVGVDTTGRLQTVWQVKWMAMPDGNSYSCATPDSEIAYPPASSGRLSTNVVPNPTAGPCCLTTSTGYTGLENQFYRVEIHQGGTGSDAASTKGATFKWSRDNASVTTGVTAIASGTNTEGDPASVLTVMSLGRDQVLGFSPGDYIEILDDWSELWGLAGILCQIDSIGVAAKTITLTTTVPTGPTDAGTAPPSFPVDSNGRTDPGRHTRIIRWDQSGTVYKLDGTNLEPWCDLATTGGIIPVPAADTTLVLEDGVTVTFSLAATGGAFNVGDFWSFDARTADGSVEILNAAPPRGIHHHYTKLSIVSFGQPPSNTDCRTPWGCAGQSSCGCCVATVGAGGQYASIQEAINSLPKEGGEVCILPGRYFERVIIQGLSNITIRGCGGDTRIASPSLQPNAPQLKANAPKLKAHAAVEGGFGAIITILGSQHVELTSFAVEAGDGEVGVLMNDVFFQTFKAPGNIDITIEDLAITASTLPAIAAVGVDLLKLARNRIAMMDVPGQWASLYASGTELHIEGNWVGLQDAPNARNWIPSSVVGDLADQTNAGVSGFGGTGFVTPQANGGIHIGAGSRDVFIDRNEIEGGVRNGITLGSFALLNSDGNDTGGVTGLLPTAPPAQPPGSYTLQLPAVVPTGDGTRAQLGAGAGLQNIAITGNRIRNMGLCGIGPVGFFDLAETIEVITIENLLIAGNLIAGTVQDVITPSQASALSLGYGAIALADVQALTLRDNIITDFGILPGAQVCGIFLLMAEQIEISGNRVLETRDWANVPKPPASPTNTPQGGIVVLLTTPPALDQATTGSAWQTSLATGNPSNPFGPPIYQPGLPALRVENNVVRVPLGLAFEAFGFGPFSIIGNHFGSGGTINIAVEAQRVLTTPLTVAILNLGLAIEIDTPQTSFSSISQGQTPLSGAQNVLASSTCGAVLFANNICQLEARASGATGLASVEILTLDHLIFSNNHCWLDGRPGPAGAVAPGTAITDAFLIAGSLQVCGNRFQESPGAALISGYTLGQLNVTTQNISTYCLFALSPSGQLADTANLVINSQLCSDRTGA